MATRTDLIALHEILTERSRQDAKWGEQNHPDGTGAINHPLDHPLSLSDSRLDLCGGAELAEIFKGVCDKNTKMGSLTWKDILLEEVFEALAEESDSDDLTVEVTQTAAVAVGWLGAISRRTMPATRVYIAGPVADTDNHEAIFASVANAISTQGHVAINPLDIAPLSHPSLGCPDGYSPGTQSEHTSSACFMRTDLISLLTCDSIMMLPGWETSRGATVEKSVAEACGMPVHYWVEESAYWEQGFYNDVLASPLEER